MDVHFCDDTDFHHIHKQKLYLSFVLRAIKTGLNKTVWRRVWWAVIHTNERSHEKTLDSALAAAERLDEEDGHTASVPPTNWYETLETHIASADLGESLAAEM
jgi:hypothetical protein